MVVPRESEEWKRLSTLRSIWFSRRRNRIDTLAEGAEEVRKLIGSVPATVRRLLLAAFAHEGTEAQKAFDELEHVMFTYMVHRVKRRRTGSW